MTTTEERLARRANRIGGKLGFSSVVVVVVEEGDVVFGASDEGAELHKVLYQGLKQVLYPSEEMD